MTASLQYVPTLSCLILAIAAAETGSLGRRLTEKNCYLLSEIGARQAAQLYICLLTYLFIKNIITVEP